MRKYELLHFDLRLWLECNSCWRQWLSDHHSTWSLANNVKSHRTILYWQPFFCLFYCSLNGRHVKDWSSFVKWDSFHSVTNGFGRLCFLYSSWWHLEINLYSFRSNYFPIRHKITGWDPLESSWVIALLAYLMEVLQFSQCSVALENCEQLLGRASSWHQLWG